MRRINRQLATRCLHTKGRSALLLALAMAGALAITGIALAAPPSSNVGFSFNPSNPGVNTFKPGKLSIHTHTNYTPPVGNSHPGGATSSIQLFFDDDFKFTPSAAPTCSASLAGKTMAQALATACGNANIGSGTAGADANGNFIAHGCLLVFNRPGPSKVLLFIRLQVGGPNMFPCGAPASNNGGNKTVLLPGTLSTNANAGGADFIGGKELVFKSITSHSSIPITDLNFFIQKGNYVSARCHDANKKWNLHAVFTYNSQTTDVVNANRTCS